LHSITGNKMQPVAELCTGNGILTVGLVQQTDDSAILLT